MHGGLIVPEPKITTKLFVALAVCLLTVVSMGAKFGRKSAPPPPPTTTGYKPVMVYDASRDPDKDLQDAIAEATRIHKRILMVVGGDWCVYCGMLDNAFDRYASLRKARDENYVTLKVNYSKENPNAIFFSKYPKIPDYPHFFVLDSKGELLHSEPTHHFEHGKTYNAGKIDAFLKKWSQPPRHWLNSVG